MTKQELRDALRMDAQAAEEITMGDDPIEGDRLAELEQRAYMLLRNVRLYRTAVQPS